jgi:hypothetical protein
VDNAFQYFLSGCEMDLREVECESLNWTELNQYGV